MLLNTLILTTTREVKEVHAVAKEGKLYRTKFEPNGNVVIIKLTDDDDYNSRMMQNMDACIMGASYCKHHNGTNSYGAVNMDSPAVLYEGEAENLNLGTIDTTSMFYRCLGWFSDPTSHPPIPKIEDYPLLEEDSTSPVEPPSNSQPPVDDHVNPLPPSQTTPKPPQDSTCDEVASFTCPVTGKMCFIALKVLEG